MQSLEVGPGLQSWGGPEARAGSQALLSLWLGEA